MTLRGESMTGLALHYRHVPQASFEKNTIKNTAAHLANESAICHFCNANKTAEVTKIAIP